MSVAGVLLAAGASRRMGRNKLLLDVQGAPMVRRMAERMLGAGLEPLVVVLGHEADRARAALDGLPITFATSPDPTGPTSVSLHAGLRALEREPGITAALVLLADMIRVEGEMIRALVDADRVHDGPLVVSRYGEVNAPPLLFRRALWPELLAWHGEGCGKAVVNAHREDAYILDWPAAALRDVDTPHDYEELVR